MASTRQPLALSGAFERYAKLLIEYDHLEAAVRDGRVSPTCGVARLQALREQIGIWGDAYRACRKREQECEGA